jgi:hypothetical protein
VRAYVDSFRSQGLKTCLYFSILDLRGDIRPYCVTRQKIDRVKAQLTELLTNYGEITALVIDGWNAAWSRLNYEEMPFLANVTQIREAIERRNQQIVRHGAVGGHKSGHGPINELCHQMA